MVHAFADDIVLVDVIGHGINIKLEIWRDVFESKDFQLSWELETKNMKFSNSRTKIKGHKT